MKSSFDYELFGLEPRDLRIYEAMLTNPQACSIRTIAEHVKMNRGTTFEVIKKLVELGLVSGYYKNSRKQYHAEPPEKLKNYAADRQLAVSDELAKIGRYTSQLDAMIPTEPLMPFGRTYEGEEEIAVLLHDVLATAADTPEKVYRVISSAEVRNHMYGKFRNFTRQRIKQSIFVRVIGVGGEDSKAELAERKILSTEEVPASYIIIYGDKVAQITLTSLEEIQGSVVENVGVAQLQRLLFDQLWDRL